MHANAIIPSSTTRQPSGTQSRTIEEKLCVRIQVATIAAHVSTAGSCCQERQ
jgi:hypothetical protein